MLGSGASVCEQVALRLCTHTTHISLPPARMYANAIVFCQTTVSTAGACPSAVQGTCLAVPLRRSLITSTALSSSAARTNSSKRDTNTCSRSARARAACCKHLCFLRPVHFARRTLGVCRAVLPCVFFLPCFPHLSPISCFFYLDSFFSMFLSSGTKLGDSVVGPELLLPVFQRGVDPQV
jgi:hypothetical protein